MRVLGGRYRLEERLGGGGMSVVWRGQDLVLSRPVAVKVVSSKYAAEALAHERIKTEAKAGALLSHPNITNVYDYGESIDDNGERAPYVVMELLDGQTLAQRLRDGPVPARIAMEICAQVASALAAAHERGLVHRDIKPANVMVTPVGAKVMDFGIAAIAGETGESSSGGTVWGTPAYVAPERLTPGQVRPASDVYSLGLLLYRALTGRAPWSAVGATEILAAHVNAEPDPLPADIGVPAEVADLCHRCLAKDPDARPTAADLASALAAAAGVAVVATAPVRPAAGSAALAAPAVAAAASSAPTSSAPTSSAPTSSAPSASASPSSAGPSAAVLSGAGSSGSASSGPADAGALVGAAAGASTGRGGGAKAWRRKARRRPAKVAGSAAAATAAAVLLSFCAVADDNAHQPGPDAAPAPRQPGTTVPSTPPPADGPGTGQAAGPQAPAAQKLPLDNSGGDGASGQGGGEAEASDQRAVADGTSGTSGSGSGGSSSGSGSGSSGGSSGSGSGSSGGGSGNGSSGGGSTSTPSPKPKPNPVEKTISTLGGTVVARCVGSTAELVSWSPLLGFVASDVNRGPAAEVSIVLHALLTDVSVTVRCKSGVPQASIEVG